MLALRPHIIHPPSDAGLFEWAGSLIEKDMRGSISVDPLAVSTDSSYI